MLRSVFWRHSSAEHIYRSSPTLPEEQPDIYWELLLSMEFDSTSHKAAIVVPSVHPGGTWVALIFWHYREYFDTSMSNSPS